MSRPCNKLDDARKSDGKSLYELALNNIFNNDFDRMYSELSEYDSNLHAFSPDSSKEKSVINYCTYKTQDFKCFLSTLVKNSKRESA